MIEIMPRALDPVARIDVHLLGPRGYLHTRVKLPEHCVSDLPELLAAAQAICPATDVDSVVRSIWRLGCRAVRRNNERRVPVRTSDLPLARAVEQPTARHNAGPSPDTSADASLASGGL